MWVLLDGLHVMSACCCSVSEWGHESTRFNSEQMLVVDIKIWLVKYSLLFPAFMQKKTKKHNKSRGNESFFLTLIAPNCVVRISTTAVTISNIELLVISTIFFKRQWSAVKGTFYGRLWLFVLNEGRTREGMFVSLLISTRLQVPELLDKDFFFQKGSQTLDRNHWN